MSMPQQVTWQVTAVTPDVQFNQAGQQVPGKQLTITTSTGYEGTVFVPSSVAGNPDTVRKLIEAEVMQVAGLQNLSGNMPAGQ